MLCVKIYQNACRASRVSEAAQVYGLRHAIKTTRLFQRVNILNALSHAVRECCSELRNAPAVCASQSCLTLSLKSLVVEVLSFPVSLLMPHDCLHLYVGLMANL